MITTEQLRQAVKRARGLGERSKTLYTLVINMYEVARGQNVTARRLAVWRAELAAELEPQTVNNYLDALRMVCRRVAKREGCADPARAITPIKIKKKKPVVHRVLTADELRKLLPTGDSLVDVRDRAIMLCGLQTGLRRAELCSFAYETMDATATSFRVGAKQVRLDTATWSALTAWLDRRAAVGVSPRGAIWCSLSHPRRDDGSIDIRKGLSTTAYYDIVCGRARAAGLPWVRPNTLRRGVLPAAGKPDTVEAE